MAFCTLSERGLEAFNKKTQKKHKRVKNTRFVEGFFNIHKYVCRYFAKTKDTRQDYYLPDLECDIRNLEPSLKVSSFKSYEDIDKVTNSPTNPKKLDPYSLMTYLFCLV